MMTLKLPLYRLSTTSVGQTLLSALSFGVSVPHLRAPGTEAASQAENQAEKKSSRKKHPFLVLITIDTESGYVAADERRVWQKESSSSFQGYHAGIRNLRAMFLKHGVKSTFFLSTHCFSSAGEDHAKITKELKALLREGHELGLHPHPDSDKALQQKLGRAFQATSCFFYDERQLLEFIATSKKIVGEHLGKQAENRITSIRWGNWALNTDGAKAIAKSGFIVDSSATPGISGHNHDGRKFDWSAAREHHPWSLSTQNYQSTQGKASSVLEIPIATFSFFGRTLRADPQYSSLLTKAFLHYYHRADRSAKPFPFVVITHSPEATTREGKQTQVVQDLEKFIIFAKQFPDVEFVTAAQAGKRHMGRVALKR